MIEFDTEIIDIIQRTFNVKSFRLKVTSDVNFKAGQFFLFTIKVEGKDESKYFSFSNSPTEKGYLEFTKRITQSPFSQTLNKVKIGYPAHMKMPYGSMTFEGEYKKIAFLSGGIGITPIRSMCKFVADTKLPTDIVLLYGNNTESDIVFKEDLDEMCAAHKNIKVVHTLTAQGIDKKVYRGRVGYINDQMIKEEIPDFSERVFYICGPTKMVEGLAQILKDKLNIQKNMIKTENFIGY